MHLRNFDPTRPDPRVDPTRVHPCCRTKRPSAAKTAYWHERPKVRRCTSVKNSECQQNDLIFYPLQNEHPVQSGQRLCLQSHFRCFGSAAYNTLDKIVTAFYRAMHYSAKRIIEIACRTSVSPSVCPSVTLVDQDHTT